LRRSRQVLMNLLLRLRERFALSGTFPDQLAFAAAVGPLRAAAAVLLSLETGETVPRRDALRKIAEISGKTDPLETILAARESGGVPPAGGEATLRAAIELAGELSQRAERLALLTELGRLAPQPLDVVIERDGRYPPFSVLLQQLDAARAALSAGRHAAGQRVAA
jgi:hypothetical protein